MEPSAPLIPHTRADSPRAVSVPSTSASYSLPGTGGTQIATGIYVHPGMNVRVRLTGGGTVTDPCATEPWSVPLTPNGVYDYGVEYSLLNVSADLTPPGAGIPSMGWEQGDDGSWLLHTQPQAYDLMNPADSVELRLVMRDMGPYRCHDGPRYIVSGGWTAAVDFVGFDMQTSAHSVTAGTSVHFTATPVNFTPTPGGGYRSWRYRYDSVYTVGDSVKSKPAYTDVVACNNAQSCDYAPPATGFMEIMFADETTGGSILSWSDAVTVIKCPTNDPLLDLPAFRQILRASLDSSGAYSNKPDSARREIPGFVTRNLTTGKLTYRFGTVSSNTPCSVNWGLTVPAGEVLMATWHTHPFKPATSLFSSADILPVNCGALAGGQYQPVPSADDWRSALKVKVPSYSIDKAYVQKADGSDPAAADSTKWGKLAKRYDWNTKKCKWF